MWSDWKGSTSYQVLSSSLTLHHNFADTACSVSSSAVNASDAILQLSCISATCIHTVYIFLSPRLCRIIDFIYLWQSNRSCVTDLTFHSVSYHVANLYVSQESDICVLIVSCRLYTVDGVPTSLVQCIYATKLLQNK
jgi:hypothetical protein